MLAHIDSCIGSGIEKDIEDPEAVRTLLPVVCAGSKKAPRGSRA